MLLVAVGCLGIAGQLVLLRELMAAYGGNEFSVGVTVAAWVLCEALGARLYGLRSSFIAHYSSLITLSLLTSLAAVPAAILVRPLLGVLPGETLSIPLLLLATFLVVLLPAATHGALFVAAAARRTQGIGSAYVWEGIGTALGGLACFLLLNRLSSLAVVALSALPLIAAAGIGPGRTRTKWATWILGLGVLASLVCALPIERWAWSRAWRGQHVASVANSPYGKTIRMERSGQHLILYDGLPTLAIPPTQSERIEELALLPVLCHPAACRVLVLGHDLAIPAALSRFRPDIEVVAIQLDPVLARTSLAALSSDSSLPPPRFSLVISDPVMFLRTRPAAFDCIILTDAAPGSLGSSRLFAAEFYRLCRERLAPGGILAIPGPGNPVSLSLDAGRILSTRQRTLLAAFEHAQPMAADFPLLLASDRALNVAAEALVSRLATLSEPPKLLDPGYVASLLDPFRQRTFAAALHPAAGGIDSAFDVRRSAFGVSTTAFPRELFLNMVRENRLVSPAFGALYARLGSSDIVHRSSYIVLLLSLVMLVAGLAGARVRGRPFRRGFAILTSGYSGAAVSALLIFAWQVRFDSVYSGVALLVVAFMLGTVLGGFLGTHSALRVHHPALITPRFLISDLLLGACAAAVLGLIRAGPAWVFLLTNCLAGACLGFQFAVAGFIAPRSSPVASAPEHVARRAGVITALDLVGGGIGGILTALVLAPVFGIHLAALAAGAVKLTSALTQSLPARPDRQT